MRFFLLLTSISLLIACQKAENINVSKINASLFQAKLLSSKANYNRPIIIFVTGSSGGFFKDKYLSGLVEAGYDVCSVAYFGELGLPRRLEEIPLEYFERCINWVSVNLNGTDRKVILMGPSRGGELALLYASHFQNIDGVIAYSPSCIVTPEAIFNRDPTQLKSSWTLKGKPLAFAPQPVLPDGGGEINYHNFITPYLTSGALLDSIRIRSENIACPVLLLSGDGDGVWPSSRMSNMLLEWAEKGGNKHFFKWIRYKDAGHQFLFFDDELPKKVSNGQSIQFNWWNKKYFFPFGGTEDGTLAAMSASKEEVITFLEEIK